MSPNKSHTAPQRQNTSMSSSRPIQNLIHPVAGALYVEYLVHSNDQINRKVRAVAGYLGNYPLGGFGLDMHKRRMAWLDNGPRKHRYILSRQDMDAVSIPEEWSNFWQGNDPRKEQAYSK
jgi:hypothetical protein